jgi:hypothetical protein
VKAQATALKAEIAAQKAAKRLRLVCRTLLPLRLPCLRPRLLTLPGLTQYGMCTLCNTRPALRRALLVSLPQEVRPPHVVVTCSS